MSPPSQHTQTAPSPPAPHHSSWKWGSCGKKRGWPRIAGVPGWHTVGKRNGRVLGPLGFLLPLTQMLGGFLSEETNQPLRKDIGGTETVVLMPRRPASHSISQPPASPCPFVGPAEGFPRSHPSVWPARSEGTLPSAKARPRQTRHEDRAGGICRALSVWRKREKDPLKEQSVSAPRGRNQEWGRGCLICIIRPSTRFNF